MKDHAHTLRQRFIAGQPQPKSRKSTEQKLAEALKFLGRKWCLHQQSTLEYLRES